MVKDGGKLVENKCYQAKKKCVASSLRAAENLLKTVPVDVCMLGYEKSSRERT